jgi:REP element-mobilizing transposase RayT
MTRRPRLDEPGTWHHVMNRGIARRTLFESELDTRNFLSRLARVVREGSLEVHAHCVLSTHFHLLVRSPRGNLSAAMQAVQNEYVRWFNRGRRRDGPLVRGRFRSKPVRSQAYRRHLVRYIDANPVSAGLVASPSLYPHGSARWYAQLRGPPWLTRSWVEATVRERRAQAEYEPASYATVFGEPLTPSLTRWIEQRLDATENGPDPLDDLLGVAPPQVVAWMRRRARLADGTDVGFPVCDVDSVDTALAAEQSPAVPWPRMGESNVDDVCRQVRISLLRELCGATLDDAAVRVGVSVSTAWRDHRRHRRWLLESDDYADRIAAIAAAAVRACHAGSPGAASEEPATGGSAPRSPPA